MSNIVLNNTGSLVASSWPVLLLAAVVGALMGHFDAFLLHSWVGVAVTTLLMLCMLSLFHLRAARRLNSKYGLNLISNSDAHRSMFAGLMFLCALLFLVLAAAGLLPMWLHSHVLVEADSAIARGDEAQLPSYFTSLGILYGIVFATFTVCASLVLWLPFGMSKR